jgi:vacuolar-type H+-ATPase subunit E/Vma4
MIRSGSIEAVIAAVHEDAAAEIETIERDCAAAMARLREDDAALPVVVPGADARLAAARQFGRDRIGAEDQAGRHAALNDRETWIDGVVAEGQRRLHELSVDERHADLEVLIRDALERMPNAVLQILVPAVDVAVARAIVEGVVSSGGKTVAAVNAAPTLASGCIAQTADRRIRYDNSYAARARRLEPIWRAQLGELYEQRLAPAIAAGGPPQNGRT